MNSSGVAMMATPIMIPHTIEIILNVKNPSRTIVLYLSASTKTVPRLEREQMTMFKMFIHLIWLFNTFMLIILIIPNETKIHDSIANLCSYIFSYNMTFIQIFSILLKTNNPVFPKFKIYFLFNVRIITTNGRNVTQTTYIHNTTLN